MASARIGTGRAHGKAILVGEHTVVYGTPAITIPLPEFPVVATAAVHREDLPAETEPVVTGGIDGSGYRLTFSVGADTESQFGPATAVQEACRRWGVLAPLDGLQSPAISGQTWTVELRGWPR